MSRILYVAPAWWGLTSAVLTYGRTGQSW